MANPEHLAILNGGVEAWNEWREKNITLYADLKGVDLSLQTLTSVNFWLTDLSDSNLRATNLDRANLHMTWLNSCDLLNSFFTNANLIETQLVNANLQETRLYRARFEKTNLVGTDFSKAVLGETIFVNADLSTARGLENTKHVFPSTIGIDTIYRSGGNIPETFLRGCGVPETFITYARSIVGKPLDFYFCFISYSSKDRTFAERLYSDLQSKGVRIWFAPEDLKTGDKFRTRIDEAIRVYDKLLIVLSENSIQSNWVEKEIEAAFEKERQQNKTVLFPVRLDDTVMETNQAWAADIAALGILVTLPTGGITTNTSKRSNDCCAI